MNKVLASIAILFISILSHGQTKAKFENISCNQHALFGRFQEAKSCAHSILDQSKDSSEIAAAYAVLARVEDEYFQYEKADSNYKRALEFVPKKGLNNETFIDLMLEVGNFKTAYNEHLEASKVFKLVLKNTTNTAKRIEALAYLTTNYYELGQIDSSNFLKQEFELLANEEDPSLNAIYYFYLGKHYYDIGDYVNCVPNLTRAISIFSNIDQKRQLADSYFLLGDAYTEAQNHPRAIYLYKQALKLFENTAQDQILNTKNTLGWAYFNLRMADSAYVYIKSALNDYEVYAPNSAWRAYPIGNLGLIYELMDSNQLAISYSIQAIELFEVLGYTPGIAEAHNNLGKVYFKLNDFESAKPHFEKAMQIASIEWFEPFELMNAKLGLSRIAEKEHKPLVSLQYLKEATVIKDSLFNLRLATQLLADEMYMSQQEAQNKLEKLEREQLENTMALRKSQFALFAITLTLLIVIGSSIAISISWKQRQTAIKKQTEILSINQEIIRMISHDFRGPMNNIRTLMELIRDETMSINEFNEVSEIIYKQTCDISLMFETFVGWALSQSNNYTPKTEKTDWDDNVMGVISLLNPLAAIKNIDIIYKKDNNHYINTDRIASQLVLRNIISNAIKYSHENSTIEVNVSATNNLLVTEIVDFGVGMDAPRLKELFSDEIESKEGTKNEIGSGLGLKMAMKFAHLNGGRIEIKSEVGAGSKFTFYLPMA